MESQYMGRSLNRIRLSRSEEIKLLIRPLKIREVKSIQVRNAEEHSR